MQDNDLQKAIDALKVIAQILSQGDDVGEDLQTALSEVSLFLTNTRLNHTIGEFTLEDEIAPEEYFDRMMGAVERAGITIPDAPTRVRVHLELGDIMYTVGRWDEALARFEVALGFAEEGNYPEGQAQALRQIGRLKRRRGHWKNAKQALNRAAKLFQAMEDEAGEAEVQLNLGNIEFEQGSYEKAEHAFNRALKISQRLNSDEMTGNINLSLGTIHQVRGQVQDAIEHYSVSLGAYEAAGDRRRMGQAHFNLGVSHRDYGEWVGSGMSYEQSLALARETRDLGLVGMIYLRRAETQALLSDATMAMVYGRRAMRIFTRLGDPLGQADTYRLYGRAAGLRRAWGQAMDYLTESVELHQQYKCRLGEAEATEEWGWLHGEMGNRADAAESYRQAREMYRELGAEKDEQRVQVALAPLETPVTQ